MSLRQSLVRVCLSSGTVDPQIRFRRVAAIGSLVWPVAAIAQAAVSGPTDMRWAAALFLLAPLVLIPLGLALIATPARIASTPRVWGTIDRLLLPSALLLALAFVMPSGVFAGCLTAPWLACTSLIALVGLQGVFKPQTSHEFYPSVGMVYLGIGGGWSVLSRLGMTVLGFSDIIVLATAVHFHYAGLVLPIMTGKIVANNSGWGARVTALAAVFAVVALAVGITLSKFQIHLPEFIAACILAVASGGIAFYQLRHAIRSQPMPVALLMAISTASILVAMGFALLFAYGGFRGMYVWNIDIPWMLRFHGTINAFGFSLLELIGWNLAEIRNGAPILK